MKLPISSREGPVITAPPLGRHTQVLAQILGIAARSARLLNAAAVRPWHLMLGIIECEESMANATMKELRVDFDILSDQLKKRSRQNSEWVFHMDSRIALAEDVEQVLKLIRTTWYHRQPATSLTLLYALMKQGSPMTKLLALHGVTPATIERLS